MGAALWSDIGKTMARGGSLRNSFPGIMQDVIASAAGNAIVLGTQVTQRMAEEVVTDAFGNVLESSLVRANWGGSDAPMDRVEVNAEQTNSAADNRTVGLKLPTDARFLYSQKATGACPKLTLRRLLLVQVVQ